MKLLCIISVASKCHHKCLYKREAEGDTLRLEGNVETERDGPQAKAGNRSQKLGELRKGFSPGASRGSGVGGPCRCLDFRLLAAPLQEDKLLLF